ncbi:MAG: FTR1 family protein [Anaerolineae bacterium]|nr:FTR1 family protein [Anaerolineae bacterium]
MLNRKLLITIIVLIVHALTTLTVGSASPEDAAQVAEQIRQTLQAAQLAAMNNDTPRAVAQASAAEQAYHTTLRPLWTADAPELVSHLDEDFAQAVVHAQANRFLALAVLRGRIWGRLLQGGMTMTLHEVERGNGRAAAVWILLRDYRPSTSVTRPQTDATQGIQALITGQRPPGAVLPVVRADLLDTYQALLNKAFYDTDQANEHGFAVRRAEGIGLAVGYFDILASTYAAQRGAAALAELYTAFQVLVDDGMVGASHQFLPTRRAINARLRGFIAAPLTDAQLSQRSSQMLRYLTLVSIEYAQGVQGGQVTNDLEYQEAVAFSKNAWMAFADLKPFLEAHPETDTTTIDGLFDRLDTEIKTRVNPAIVQATTFEITAAVGTRLPLEWRTINSAADIQAIRTTLQQVKADVLAGKYDTALGTCVSLYQILQDGLENTVLAFAPEMALRLDTLLWYGNPNEPSLAVLLATRRPVSEIQNVLLRLDAALDETEMILNSQSDPGAVVINTAVIVFREGLEALLILASLLAGLQMARDHRSHRLVLFGAVLACIGAVLTWQMARGALRLFAGPGVNLQLILSLASVGLLLLTINWFFHRTYWTNWLARFHRYKARLVRSSVSGQAVGLLLLGFFSIYREGFETVLFLQPVALKSGGAAMAVGLAAGLILIGAAGFVILGLRARLPYKKLLVVTGILIGIVLIIMVGNTVYAMQVARWMPISPIAGLYLPSWSGHWFGLYPTWQGIGLQVAAGLFVVGSYVVVERRKRRMNPVHRASEAIRVQ